MAEAQKNCYHIDLSESTGTYSLAPPKFPLKHFNAYTLEATTTATKSEKPKHISKIQKKIMQLR